MKVEQIYTGCLAQGAYYIQSENEAVIIDPLREVQQYITKAKEDGVKIKYVFETHFHADFVSGHVTLSEKTKAPIIYGPNANPKFDCHIAKDGEVFQVGKASITVLHTPGHTMESTTYLLKDETGKDYAIFTGDTLFLGDVGRPDLAQKSNEITQEDLAGYLFDSLRNKIMPLSDDLLVYPAHGAGSACGKKMSNLKVDSLGNQKETNYALRANMTKDEFIKEVTDGLLPPPAYFPINVRLNKEGYDSIDTVLHNGLQELMPLEIETLVEEGALILDVRSPSDFAEGHIPNSIFIGLDGSFAPWVGELIVDINQAIILVTPKGREEEAVTRLARVGFDKTIGYLSGGIKSWQRARMEIGTVKSITAEEFSIQMKGQSTPVVDVRKVSEHQSEHVSNAINLPLADINKFLAQFPEETFFLHCAGGYRSMIAASILKSRGIHQMIDIQGGFGAISKTDIPKSEWVCPSTL